MNTTTLRSPHLSKLGNKLVVRYCLPCCFHGVWLLVAGAVVARHRKSMKDNNNGESNNYQVRLDILRSTLWSLEPLLCVAAGCFCGEPMYESVANCKLLQQQQTIHQLLQ